MLNLLTHLNNSLTPYFFFFCLHWKLIPYIIILSSNLSKYFFKSWNLQLDSCLTIPNFEYTTRVYLQRKANKSWCFVLFIFILNFVSSIIDLPEDHSEKSWVYCQRNHHASAILIYLVWTLAILNKVCSALNSNSKYVLVLPIFI